LDSTDDKPDGKGRKGKKRGKKKKKKNVMVIPCSLSPQALASPPRLPAVTGKRKEEKRKKKGRFTTAPSSPRFLAWPNVCVCAHR